MNTAYIILGIFTAVLLITTLIGYGRGFLKTLVSMSSLIVSIVLVIILAPSVEQLITERTTLPETVKEKVTELVREAVVSGKAETAAEAVTALEENKVTGPILKLLKIDTSTVGDAADVCVERISSRITAIVVKVIGILMTLFLTFIILKIVLLITGIVEKIPIVKGANKLAGAALGLVRGLLIVGLMCYAAAAAAHTPTGQKLLTAMNSDPILSAIYSAYMALGRLLIK